MASARGEVPGQRSGADHEAGGSVVVNRRTVLAGSGLAAGIVTLSHGAATAPAMAASSGLSFTAITPYRAYDSRQDNDNPVAEADKLYRIIVTTDAGGTTKITGARAVSFNLTVADTQSSGGYLSIMPGNQMERPSFSTINWNGKGWNLANGGVVALGSTSDTANAVSVYCGGGGRTAFIIDVTGYYS